MSAVILHPTDPAIVNYPLFAGSSEHHERDLATDLGVRMRVQKGLFEGSDRSQRAGIP